MVLQIASTSTLAQNMTTTTRTLNEDGITSIVTEGNAKDPSANPPASIDIGEAGRQYVQQQQRGNSTSGRMTGTFGFGIGLVTLLAVGIIAYAIHPNKKRDNDFRKPMV